MSFSTKIIITTFYNLHVIIFFYATFVNGLAVNEEVVERGRTQYELLKKKADLPQYGSCWKSAVKHLDKGCRFLTENIQSEIALHITNCFLEMSGHPTYDCELDKKKNLRAICINSMSDRAFNVYTEFYTHTQNICWFLQGQIWHEIIVDNTVKVGKQLKETAQNQEGLLQAQKESLKLQVKMLEHGEVLEKVFEDIFISFKTHQDILRILSETISNLQDWIIGEISWIDSIIFYSVSVLLVFTFTATQRTSSARLPMLFLFSMYLFAERFLCSIIISNNSGVDAHSVYSNIIYKYVWYFRYGLVVFSATVLVYKAIFHEDLFTKHFKLLCLIQNQNTCILNVLKDYQKNSIFDNTKIHFIDESKKSTEIYQFSYSQDIGIPLVNFESGDDTYFKSHFESSDMTGVIDNYEINNLDKEVLNQAEGKNSKLTSNNNDDKLHVDIRTERYNLRSSSSVR